MPGLAPKYRATSLGGRLLINDIAGATMLVPLDEGIQISSIIEDPAKKLGVGRAVAEDTTFGQPTDRDTEILGRLFGRQHSSIHYFHPLDTIGVDRIVADSNG